MSDNPSQPDSTTSAVPEFGQEGIDALVDSHSDGSETEAATTEPGSEGENDSIVSQDDIDALIDAVRGDSASPDERLDSTVRRVDATMRAGVGEEKTAVSTDASSPASSGVRRPDLPSFDGAATDVDPKRVTMLNDVKLRVKIELGRTRMLVEDVLKLSEGSVVELDKLAGDPVDVYVNDRLVARGEVLVLNDNFCVRISDVLSNDPHRISA